VFGAIARFDSRFRSLIGAINGSSVRIAIVPNPVFTARCAKRRIASWFPAR